MTIEERQALAVDRLRQRLTRCGGQNAKLVVRDKEIGIIDAVQDTGHRQDIMDAWNTPFRVEDPYDLESNEHTFLWISLTDAGLLNTTVFPEASENNHFRAVHRSYRSRAVLKEVMESIADATVELENLGYL